MRRAANSVEQKARGLNARKRSDIAFAALASLIAAFYIELFRESVNSFRDGDAIGLFSLSLTPQAVVVVLAAFAGMFLVMLAALLQKKVLRFLFTWRYPLAAAVLAVLVILQVNGSSVALWGRLLDGADNAQLEGVLFGVPRAVRSDEYLVFTPMALSQEHTGYAALSDLLRGGSTDVTMVYGQPAWAVATLFRPFLWGYLVLGSAYGLSLFWCGRIIVLFLVSFEFGRFFTQDNRLAALSYALIMAFSPLVQWWFSTNGTAELVIFSQGGILAFSAFLRSQGWLRKVVMAVLAAYSASCFIMIVYPAWQVSVAYFAIAFCIGDLVHCRKAGLGALSRGVGARRAFVSYWLVLIAACAVFGALVVMAFQSSWDVIQTVRSTSYPGRRVSTGGGLAPLLFDWASSWLYPVAPDLVAPNACERAGVFSLFPLGIFLAIAALWKRRDPYLVALLVVDALLLAFGLFGFPEWLAKLTLLSQVTTTRLQLALGMVNAVVLLRAASMLNACAESRGRAGADKRKIAAIVFFSLAFGAACAYAMLATNTAFAFKVLLVLSAALVALSAFAALSFSLGASSAYKLACVAAVLALSGFCVNPIQQGIAPLVENDLLQEAAAISEQESDALWAGDNNIASQALVASGLPALNSVATYPDLETWRTLDEDGAYEEIYNRYAHIGIQLTDEETSFSLSAPDAFLVNLNVGDVAKLGIGYWLSQNRLEDNSTEDVAFVPLKSNGVWTIYKVEC